MLADPKSDLKIPIKDLTNLQLDYILAGHYGIEIQDPKGFDQPVSQVYTKDTGMPFSPTAGTHPLLIVTILNQYNPCIRYLQTGQAHVYNSNLFSLPTSRGVDLVDVSVNSAILKFALSIEKENFWVLVPRCLT